jgi:hypothetical protein
VVAPSSGYNPCGPLVCHPLRGRIARQQLPWSFSPLRRLSLDESTHPRFASPGTFRPQGFSPSRRIAPHPDAQPYFRLVTPLGFRSTGAFPHCQVPRARRPARLPSWRLLLRAFPRTMTLTRHLTSEPDTCRPFLRLQGLAPAVDPYRQRCLFRAPPNGRSPLELPSPLGSSPLTRGSNHASCLPLLRFSPFRLPSPLWDKPSRVDDESRFGRAPASSPSGAVSRSLNRDIPF